MPEETLVFESPTLRDRRRMLSCIRASRKCYVVEPFHAYHHNSVKGVPFFPLPLPAFVKEWIDCGQVSLLRADQLGARELYLRSTEQAVAATEQVFSLYRDRHRGLCEFLVSVLGTVQAEDAFRRLLCEKLSVFFSINILLAGIERALPDVPIKVFVRNDPGEYLRLKALVAAAQVEAGEHSRTALEPRPLLKVAATRLAGKAWRLLSLLAMMARSCVPSRRCSRRQSYLMGFTIISPKRQFRSNERGADFLVDGKRIRREDVIYLPLTPLTAEQKRMLRDLGSDTYDPLADRSTHTPLRIWMRLFALYLRTLYAVNEREVFVASSSVAEYHRWKHLVKHIAIRNLVTHADFGLGRIARNIALRQSGVRTWYFTDASNFGLNFTNERVGKARHPLWTYLNYDVLVTWCRALAEWLTDHPSSFRKVHVVGCLWAQHVRQHRQLASSGVRPTVEGGQGKLVVVAFGSTYSVKCVTAYEEGIAFVKDLLRLAAECPDVFIVLKDKKQPSMHLLLEPELGKELIALHAEVAARPNMDMAAPDSDSSKLMSQADLTVSFPFTSTTFEALAADRPAVWHDPLGYYRDSPYRRAGGALTHGYDELRELVERLRTEAPGPVRSSLPSNSPLFDPFRDGKAIDRFRQLLTSSG